MTSYAQYFCTTADMIRDLKLSGDEPDLLGQIRAASQYLSNAVGNFIPVVETRTFYPNRHGELPINPLLVVLKIVNDTEELTADAYSLHPGERCYPHGPYARIHLKTGCWSPRGVHITAYWGKFEEIRPLSVDPVTQTDSATTLTLSNGSQAAAGMILLLDTEQELITGGNGDGNSPDPTQATSLVDGLISQPDEEIDVDDGTEFHRGEVIRLGTEDCMIRRIVGNTLVIARVWNGTTKSQHADDTPIYVYRTYAVERAVNGTGAMAHTDEPVYRYAVPDDVNWIARQVAGLMRMKAAVGFANKSGNADLGEVFYYSEFPNQINKIRSNYWVR